MTRDDVAAELGDRFGQYLLAVDRTATDTAGNLKVVLDDALRALGYAEADIPTAVPADAAAEADVRLQAAYRLMRQVVRDLGPTAFNVSTGGDSFSLGDLRKNAETDLQLLEADVLLHFGTLGDVALPDALGGLATIDLNYAEPDCLPLDRSRFAWLGGW